MNKITRIDAAGGGASYTGDAQGALDTVYAISGGIISGTLNNYSFTANNITKLQLGDMTINDVDGGITKDRAGYPNYNWSLNRERLIIGPTLSNGYWEGYNRVYLNRSGLSAMSGFSTDPKLIWKAILDTDIAGTNNTITSINGSALAAGYTPTYHGIEI